ncbi:hypothetical protein [Hansschlegelia zhihuaiae]|uniref:Methyltransferase domain-containing protein n=1 Tax=Hansschlegelia zhihuaiae TaxID=405005 RepID=A0A4Q0MN43_9HYPH|nr:hypothetical protein [Hansschlegelia zhihuaiae]RXF74456.1 hypothetical protein EK403_06520 [Hansschlegelia zhihuaiae]
MARTRYLALAISKLAPPPSGYQVVHFAPEKGLAKLLHAKYASHYVAADYAPERYSNIGLPVKFVDLREPGSHFPPDSVQGFIHSHILEHIPAPIDKVVTDMNNAVRKGGFHIFVLPVRGQRYREDLSPDLSPEERSVQFGHPEHMRDFGRRDLPDLLARWFSGWSQQDMSLHITEDELMSANIPATAQSQMTGHSVFFFSKNS